MALAIGLGLLIGLTLGALGGGGSILTVPVLVYLLGESAQSATTASLVIVGITSAVAALGHARGGRVHWRAGLAFGAVGVPASVLGTRLNADVHPDVLLVSFAALMLVAASAMLVKTMVPSRPAEAAEDEEAARLRVPAAIRASSSAAGRPPAAAPGRPSLPAPRPRLRARVWTALKVVVAGLVVGFLTGFLGVGGGFVIVPALVLALRYEMAPAVGTSLLIISLNSGVALLARGGEGSFHWEVIVPFTLAAVVGSFGGKRVADKISATALTRSFAVLLLMVAGYVLVRAGSGI